MMASNQGTPSGRLRGRVGPAAVLCVLLTLLALPGQRTSTQHAHSGRAQFSTTSGTQDTGADAPPRCLGARDLDVRGMTVALSGTRVFERVCVTDGGRILVTDALTLSAGLLYVDPTGLISGDPPQTYSCGQAGQLGIAITLVTRRAVLLGSITSNGGVGSSFDPERNCYDYRAGGTGGAIVIQTLTLTRTGPISATGAAGDDTVGDGGHGGSVTIGVAAPLPTAAMVSHVDVAGGLPAATAICLTPGCTVGRAGARGSISIAVLDAGTALPPPPAPLIAALGSAPTRGGLAGVLATERCGQGDLDVGASQHPFLDGVHRYVHVCIHDGGVLRGGRRLVLLAGAISVDAGARITADGMIHGGPGTPGTRATGQYVDGGDDHWPRAIPHAGVPGANGTGADSGVFGEGGPVPAPAGGRGGGSLALIARRVRIAGTVSADGAPGADGGQGSSPISRGYQSPSTGNAGGGSGGGLYIRADTLWLTGRLSVRGGRNGVIGDGPLQPPGASGQVTLLVGILDAPAGDLLIDGSGLLGRTLPSDPVPPPTDPAAQYAAATDHALSGPFLAYWRLQGGLDVFGYPQTESFVEGGVTVQYTDRFRLEAAGGQVRTAPLGRLLTAGRAFPRVAAMPSKATQAYFPATGHTLSGLFLAYWQAHDGATLLGAPISEVVTEGNGDGTGRRYPLQWFERGRLEYHAEHAGTRYAVQLGQLGVEALRVRGWLP